MSGGCESFCTTPPAVSFIRWNVSMNIAFDLTQIPVIKTGVGIHALNLTRELLKQTSQIPHFNLLFFYQDDDPEWKEMFESFPHCKSIPINHKTFRNLICRFFFEQSILPHRCKKENIDYIFSFHYTMPYFTSIKRIVVFADMTFYLFPLLHQKIKRIYFKSLIPFSLKYSHKIVTVSQSTRRDILEHFPNIAPEKFHVIHHGVTPTISSPNASNHLETFKLTPKKYFLYVGTLEPRKNIPGIIDAFFHAVVNNPQRQEGFKLVITGKKGWFYDKIFETVSKLGIEDEVIFTGYIDENVKNSLLSNAFGFVYPSYYEGFGLPILEAMVYGIPVITGNVSSLPEVAGDAAILVNPQKWEEISEAMTRLLSNPDFYIELSKKSSARAQLFTWQKAAEKTLALFLPALDNPVTDIPDDKDGDSHGK